MSEKDRTITAGETVLRWTEGILWTGGLLVTGWLVLQGVMDYFANR